MQCVEIVCLYVIKQSLVSCITQFVKQADESHSSHVVYTG